MARTAHDGTARPRPLDGVRVLDLGTVYAAPIAAMLLGDFGADVVKVERSIAAFRRRRVLRA